MYKNSFNKLLIFVTSETGCFVKNVVSLKKKKNELISNKKCIYIYTYRIFQKYMYKYIIYSHIYALYIYLYIYNTLLKN